MTASPSASSRFRNLCAAAALGVTLLASVPAFSADATASVQIRQAWIRWLPANLPAGGYLTVINSGDREVVLTGISCPDYSGVALHRSLEQHGSSTMVPVDRIPIPAHSTLSFAAQGYHVMLTQPKTAVAPGDHVAGSVHFANGASLAVDFEVRKPDALAPADSKDAPGMPAMPGMPGMPGMPATPH